MNDLPPTPAATEAGGNFTLPASLDFEALCAAFPPHFFPRVSRTTQSDAVFFDTFEWNLWFNQLLLVQSDGTLRLETRDCDWPGILIATTEMTLPPPRFAADLPPGPLIEMLWPLTKIRALQPVARIGFETRTVELLNADEKVVFRFDVEDVRSADDPVGSAGRICRLRPLRGYESEADMARDVLARVGAVTALEGPLSRVFHASGKVPRRYTLQPSFALAPDLAAREAARVIIRHMLALVRENEPGLTADIDTEFLHDYRVAIRKIRSVLSLVKSVYPDDRTAELKTAFSALGGATNRLRDLDVYLLARGNYAALLPPSLRPALDEMFTDFAAEREGEQRATASRLATDEYAREISALESFFGEPDTLPPSANSDAAIGPFVAGRIYKRYRRIRRVQRMLGDDTPDEAIHQLRIHCKKLRYLLEFFSELFPAEITKPIEKSLRRLQARLGTFNDLSVQQKSLFHYWSRKRTQPGAHEDLGLSLGGLIAMLNDRQQNERRAIHDALSAFCAPEVATPLRSLFRPSAPGDDPSAP